MPKSLKKRLKERELTIGSWLQIGSPAVAEIMAQPTFRHQASGRVIEILGDHMAPGLETEVVVRSFEIPCQWSEKVLQAVDDLPLKQVPSEETEKRRDLRDLPLLTIDGEDAKDFDDAVYCEPLKKAGQGWRLFVAIADVSHYVKPKTALDEVAHERGNSVYFPGRVIPMLPFTLRRQRRPMFDGQNILISGGTGSFGQAFTRHLLKNYHPTKVVILSRDDTKQHDMRQRFNDSRLRFQLGDVRELERLRLAFTHIDVVIHAASLKHVPAGEHDPWEFTRTIITGTENVTRAAIDCGVERCHRIMHVFEVLCRPLITEKSSLLQVQGKYAFEVAGESNKNQIKQAVETAFKVDVTAVNIIMVPGKQRRVGRQQVLTPSWKKAIVTLKPGDKIELFEGV